MARPDGVTAFTFPALGVVDVPFAAAPDLGGARIAFVAPRDFIWNDTDPLDLDGHGTHVAGTIGQLTNNSIGVAGMAFNVRIMPVKVIDSLWDDIFGSPFEGTDDVVARGVRYAVDNGAKVLNMSIGRAGPPTPAVAGRDRLRRRRTARSSSIAAGNDFERGQSDRMAGGVRATRSRAWSRSARSAAIASARTTRRPDRTSNWRRPAAISAPAARRAASCSRRYDFSFVDTYVNGPAQLRPAALRHLRVSVLPGHLDGDAARVGLRRAADAAGHHESRRRSKRPWNSSATDLGPPGRDDQYGYGLINPRASLRGLGLAK